MLANRSERTELRNSFHDHFVSEIIGESSVFPLPLSLPPLYLSLLFLLFLKFHSLTNLSLDLFQIHFQLTFSIFVNSHFPTRIYLSKFFFLKLSPIYSRPFSKIQFPCLSTLSPFLALPHRRQKCLFPVYYSPQNLISILSLSLPGSPSLSPPSLTLPLLSCIMNQT